MAHIHDLIDFTVQVYIVHENKVLFIHHKKLEKWLPIGGHIELDEDPEQAAYREAKEESGLDITLLGSKPEFNEPGIKMLIPPVYLDIHDISPTHKHIGLAYFATAATAKITLAEQEHHDIRWLGTDDFDKPEYDLLPHVKFMASEALKQASQVASPIPAHNQPEHVK